MIVQGKPMRKNSLSKKVCTPNLITTSGTKKFGVRVSLIGQLLTDEIHHLTDETDQLNVNQNEKIGGF